MRNCERAVAAALFLMTLACGTQGREPPRLQVLTPTVSPARCLHIAADADQDTLNDDCELALAQAFAPELVVDSGDCLWRTDVSPARLGGAYLYAAQRTAGGVRIAFLPAYYRDCGWTGRVCMLRGRNCGAHAGDSELIVVDVSPNSATGRWETVGVFLSAHCFGRADGRCRWYRGDDLSDFTWSDDASRGAPRVWVARGKHAHYPSKADCDRGHWFYDSCDGNEIVLRFPIASEKQNIGSRRNSPFGPAGCLTSEELPLERAGTSTGTRECVWDAATPFWGWQADRSGDPPMPYARYLASMAAF